MENVDDLLVKTLTMELADLLRGQPSKGSRSQELVTESRQNIGLLSFEKLTILVEEYSLLVVLFAFEDDFNVLGGELEGLLITLLDGHHEVIGLGAEVLRRPPVLLHDNHRLTSEITTREDRASIPTELSGSDLLLGVENLPNKRDEVLVSLEVVLLGLLDELTALDILDAEPRVVIAGIDLAVDVVVVLHLEKNVLGTKSKLDILSPLRTTIFLVEASLETLYEHLPFFDATSLLMLFMSLLLCLQLDTLVVLLL